MIKKLDMHLARNINSCNMAQNIMVAQTAIEKINELVDAVNELQKHEEQHLDLLTQLNEMRLQQTKEPADPYAEQRKWIGCLCWFWDDKYDLKTAGVLEEIITIGEYPYSKKGTFTVWKHCEPVKSDDDSIYKGGDNE